MKRSIDHEVWEGRSGHVAVVVAVIVHRGVVRVVVCFGTQLCTKMQGDGGRAEFFSRD